MNDLVGLLLDNSNVLAQHWPDLVTDTLLAVCVWLIKRLVSTVSAKQDEHDEKLATHARQIGETRAAISACEAKIGVQHYPYTD